MVRPKKNGHLAIYQDLLQLLASGEIALGQLMPSENELTLKYNTTRFYIRKALQMLEQDGIIEKRQGFGRTVILLPDPDTHIDNNNIDTESDCSENMSTSPLETSTRHPDTTASQDRQPAASIDTFTSKQYEPSEPTQLSPVREVNPMATPMTQFRNAPATANNAFFGRRGQAAFTLVELLVVIAIIAILASFLMPALSKARDSARTISCINQQRQIGYALQLYADENNDYAATAVPTGNNGWFKTLGAYFSGSLQMWACPGTPEAATQLNVNINTDSSSVLFAKFRNYAGIGINGWQFKGRDTSNNLNIPKLTKMRKPGKLIYSADGRLGVDFQELTGGDPANNGLLYLVPTDNVYPIEEPMGHFSYHVRHQNLINIGFVDGHAKSISGTEFFLWKAEKYTVNGWERFIGDHNMGE